MRCGGVIRILVTAVTVPILAGAVVAEEKRTRVLDPREPQLVLHYDFYGVEDGRVSDASGQKHDGQLVGGEIVPGRRRPAVAFAGAGSITVTEGAETLDFVSRTLSVGARCKPASADGVIISVGDQVNGFSLYLKNGIPHFSVRADGKLTTVAGSEVAGTDRWVHLFGTIDAKGNITLVSNGWPVSTKPGRPLADVPAEPMCVGADYGEPAGEYTGPQHWHGLIESVRLYWGVVDRVSDSEELGDWADLPGCGCNR